MDCSFCDKKAIFVGGKGYCEKDLGQFESRFLEGAVIKQFTSRDQILDFFRWVFGTEFPKLSDLQKWHSRIQRLEKKTKDWRKDGIYVESQGHHEEEKKKECALCEITNEKFQIQTIFITPSSKKSLPSMPFLPKYCPDCGRLING